MPTREPYRVVLADPPWTFQTYSEKGKGRSPERHYNCMTLEAIRELGKFLVPPLVHPDSVLLLWVTYPQLPEGLRVGEAWGFRYKAEGFTWVKRTKNGRWHFGNGYYTRHNAEPCLLFRRGRGLPVADRGVPALIESVRGRHSEKPDEAYSRIERLFGDVPRLDELDGCDIRESLCRLAEECG